MKSTEPPSYLAEICASCSLQDTWWWRQMLDRWTNMAISRCAMKNNCSSGVNIVLLTYMDLHDLRLAHCWLSHSSFTCRRHLLRQIGFVCFHNDPEIAYARCVWRHIWNAVVTWPRWCSSSRTVYSEFDSCRLCIAVFWMDSSDPCISYHMGISVGYMHSTLLLDLGVTSVSTSDPTWAKM